jgi:hypothetical protein
MIRTLCLLIMIGLPMLASAYQGDYIWEDKFKKALPKAESGNVDAQYDVGEMYEKGKGTDKNLSKAFEWYKKAAEQGDVKAAYRVGVAYLKGKGVNKNSDKAHKYLKQSANKGYARAQYYMGMLYEKGIGVSQDYDTAISWYGKSKKAGYRPADERIALVKNLQEEEDRADAARAKRRAEAAARKRLSRKRAKAQTVSRKTPAESPPATTRELLMMGGWSKRNKPAEFLPSNATNCKKVNNTIECLSKTLKRDIGMADIDYETKAIIYSIDNTGEFKISYRNNVKKVTVTDPDFIESGARVPVSEGWQDAEHKLLCEVENERNILCKKDKLRKIRFNR